MILAAAAPIFIMAALPLGVAGFGTRELAAVLVFGFLGVPGDRPQRARCYMAFALWCKASWRRRCSVQQGPECSQVIVAASWPRRMSPRSMRGDQVFPHPIRTQFSKRRVVVNIGPGRDADTFVARALKQFERIDLVRQLQPEHEAARRGG